MLSHLTAQPPMFSVSKEVEFATMLGLLDVSPPVTEAIDAGVAALIVKNAIPNFISLEGVLSDKAKAWLEGGLIQKNAPLMMALSPTSYGSE